MGVEPSLTVFSQATCCADLHSLHRKYLSAAGAIFEDESGNEIPLVATNDSHVCEISPLLSYAGEALDAFQGKRLKFPILLA